MLKNVGIKAKLILLLAVSVLGIALVGMAGFIGMNKADDALLLSATSF